MNAPRERWMPRFAPGQVVSAEALNRLVDAMTERSTFVSRHFQGHGVLFGLRAKTDPRTGDWVLEPGAAIDRAGRVVVVREEFRLPLCGGNGSARAESHPQVSVPDDIDVPNLTPVLFRRDRVLRKEAPLEPDAAPLRTAATFGVALVPGRVRTDTSPVFEIRPMALPLGLRIADGARFVREYEDRRAALDDVLQQHDGDDGSVLSLPSRLVLSERASLGQPTSADLLKVALLNDLVYTLWQWERAELYLALHLDRLENLWVADRPGEDHEEGIPLGWLFEDAEGGWCFDGRWRAGFAIGLSRLEHVVGYAPRAMQEICNERFAALTRAAQELGPLEPADLPKRERATPAAITISPAAYSGGTGSWLAALRFDRPRKEAVFWPIDPLHGSELPPTAAHPVVRRAHDPRVEGDHSPVRCPAPTLMDPVNDPFAFSGYLDAQRVDRWHVGVASLAGLMGFGLAEVRAVLGQLRSEEGQGLRISEAVDFEDDDATEGLEVVLVASFREPLVIVTETPKGGEATVLAFARRVAPKRSDAEPVRRPRPGWLKRLMGRVSEIKDAVVWAIRG